LYAACARNSSGLWFPNCIVQDFADLADHQEDRPFSCLVFVLVGDNETGKTTLIAKMQGVEEPKKGSGLEYMYMNIKDEYRDGNCS